MENENMLPEGEALQAAPSPVQWGVWDTVFLCAAALAAGCYFFCHFPFMFTDSYHLPGFGWTLTQWLLMGAALLFAGKKGRLKAKGNPGGWFLLAAALGLGLCFSIFGNDGLRMMNLPVAFLCSVLAVFSLGGSNPLPALSARGLLLGLQKTLPACFLHISQPFRALGSIKYQKKGRLQGLGAGLLLGAPIALVAGLLLISADSMFSDLLKRMVTPSKKIDGAPILHLALTLAFTPPLFSLLLSGGSDAFSPTEEKEFRANPVTLSTILTMLAAVYGLFVYVQFRYLFGGVETARMAGGYAEYARNGFFELVTLAILTLLLIFPFLRLCPQSPAVRLLCGLVALLTVIIDVSAFFRMRLYIQAFGLSVLRVVTLWGMAMVLLSLIACLIKCFFPAVRVCPALTALALGSWLLLNYANVDRIVAADLVARYNGGMEHLDIRYLSTLSPDVLPELNRIENEETRAAAQRACHSSLFHRRPAAYDASLCYLMHPPAFIPDPDGMSEETQNSSAR